MEGYYLGGRYISYKLKNSYTQGPSYLKLKGVTIYENLKILN
jgi:hypothetical protein